MLERRSYREALTIGEAREELRRGAGGQFDPRVVEALLAVLDAEAAGQEAGNQVDLCGPLPGFGQPREG
jgi:HD-GYP domain-containing protein (c-di-GMP phosphodiesterase class II)